MKIIAALSRVTTSGLVLMEVDGLRFLAIASVVLYHLKGYVLVKSPAANPEWQSSLLVSALDRGWFGVILFFAISGFIISLPFASHYLGGAKPVSLKSYYLRRVTRLEPPYFICITVLFLLHLARGDTGLLPHYFSTLTYSHNLLFGEKSTIAPVAWSLEIEIQFYLLAPIVARTFAIDGKLERRTLLVVLILVGCAVQPLMNNWRLNVLMFAQCFLVGFLMADIYVSEWKSSPAKAWRWDALALAAGALLFALTGSITRVWWSPPTHSADQWVDPVWCALACLGLLALFAAAFRGRVTNAFLSIPYVSVIGGMCYTIYLYHEHVFSFVGRLAMRAHFTETFAGNYLLGIALMVPFTLAVTSALFVAFEKPFMRRVWAARLTIHTQTR